MSGQKTMILSFFAVLEALTLRVAAAEKKLENQFFGWFTSPLWGSISRDRPTWRRRLRPCCNRIVGSNLNFMCFIYRVCFCQHTVHRLAHILLSMCVLMQAQIAFATFVLIKYFFPTLGTRLVVVCSFNTEFSNWQDTTLLVSSERAVNYIRWAWP